MKWLLKASGHKLLSTLPASDGLHYLLQRRVARTLPSGNAGLRRKVARAARHVDAFVAHGPGRPLADTVLYELGAGWDLAGPLACWCLGAERQVVVDVRPNLRVELLSDVIARLERLRPRLERRLGRPLRAPGAAPVRATGELEERFGIAYLAPCDARATGLPSASVGFVSSTNTLEHVPEEDLVPLLAECRRLLEPGGVLSCRIDLQDHFSYFDAGISPYNFLRFSDRSWRLLDSRLQHQNRLRARDYLEALRRSGFEIVAERVRGPRKRDLRALRSLEPAERFRGRYSLAELGARKLFVVARPLPDRA